jgi:hypothetical protein
MIVWKSAGGGKKIPEPVLGLDKEFDAANQRVQDKKDAIQNYVESLAKKLKCDKEDLKLSTVSKKFRFEI